ncbi:MAG: hypothetical protein IJE49_07625 [Agathobacter sp.]|nr:hypothetical protein [Agathobacter sp.]
MSKKIFIALRRCILIVIIMVLFVGMSAVLERRTLYGAWNHTLKINGFKNEIENSMDIIGFGSSHMYCTLNPVHIYKESGMRSYVLATQQQPIEATYYYMKEALKTQKPEVLILEAYMFTTMTDVVQEQVAHDAIDSFPAGINKIQMINALNTVDGKENYYFNIIKYHSRWKEIEKKDFDFSWKKQTDPMHGMVFLKEVQPNAVTQVSYDNIEEAPILPTQEEYLIKMIELAKENNAELLLLIAPYNGSADALGYYKYLHRIVEEHGAKVVDLNANFDATKINNETDFYDTGHLNAFGAEKASSYILEYIKSNYNIEINDVEDEELWAADIAHYDNEISK